MDYQQVQLQSLYLGIPRKFYVLASHFGVTLSTVSTNTPGKCTKWKTRGRSLTGPALLCVVGFLPSATRPCRRRPVRRPAASYRILYRAANKALACLATCEIIVVQSNTICIVQTKLPMFLVSKRYAIRLFNRAKRKSFNTDQAAVSNRYHIFWVRWTHICR